MKRNRQLVLGVGLGVLVLLGLIFQQWVVANIIAPIATVIWLLLRLFVLSIDQVYYWWLLILLAALFAFNRLHVDPKPVEENQAPESNSTLDNIDHWRLFLDAKIQSKDENLTARRELVWLLASIYASRQQGTVNYQMRDALQSGEIPLPPQVYAFLFPPEPEDEPKPFFRDPLGAIRRRLSAIGAASRRRIRRWNGSDAAEFYALVDQTLTVMETSLEMSHDDNPSTSSQY